MSLPQLFDQYSLRARLQPALITLSPLAIAAVAWAGSSHPWMSTIWTLCSTAGLTYFFAAVVRNRGKQVEPKLWTSWGGALTTQALRHAGPGNAILRERWHKYLSKLLGRPLPDASEEQNDRIAADQLYEAATKLLIEKTRDAKKFPLIFKENVSYGFFRNLYAMRSIGATLAALGITASVWAAVRPESSGVLPWSCAGIDAVLLFVWLFRVNAASVRVSAQGYTDRLFAAIETLSRAKATTAEISKPS